MCFICSNLLSQSLPAIFLPHSNCSLENQINIRFGTQCSDTLNQLVNQGTPLANTSPTVLNSGTSPYGSNLNHSSSTHSNKTPVTNESYLNQSSSTVSNRTQFNRSGSVSRPSTSFHLRQTNASEAQGSSKMVLPLLFVVGFLVTVASMFNTTNIPRPVIYDESRFYNDIDLLGMKYHIDENAVLQMQTGK